MDFSSPDRVKTFKASKKEHQLALTSLAIAQVANGKTAEGLVVFFSLTIFQM
jgi:hypothetical protein